MINSFWIENVVWSRICLWILDELSEAEDVMNDLAVWNIQLKSKVLFISIEQMLRHEECVSIVQK